jgi:lysophospholipase L1-like esterase
MLDMNAYRVLADADKIKALAAWLDTTREIYERCAAERDDLRARLAVASVALHDAMACLEADNPGGARGVLMVGLDAAIITKEHGDDA